MPESDIDHTTCRTVLGTIMVPKSIITRPQKNLSHRGKKNLSLSAIGFPSLSGNHACSLSITVIMLIGCLPFSQRRSLFRGTMTSWCDVRGGHLRSNGVKFQRSIRTLRINDLDRQAGNIWFLSEKMFRILTSILLSVFHEFFYSQIQQGDRSLWYLEMRENMFFRSFWGPFLTWIVKMFKTQRSRFSEIGGGSMTLVDNLSIHLGKFTTSQNWINPPKIVSLRLKN